MPQQINKRYKEDPNGHSATEKMSKIRSSVNGLNSGWIQVERTEQRVSELEDKIRDCPA